MGEGGAPLLRTAGWRRTFFPLPEGEVPHALCAWGEGGAPLLRTAGWRRTFFPLPEGEVPHALCAWGEGGAATASVPREVASASTMPLSPGGEAAGYSPRFASLHGGRSTPLTIVFGDGPLPP